MKNIDLDYISTILANLCGMPIRVYKDENLFLYRSPVNLCKDPMSIYKKEIWNIKSHVSYYVTQQFDYYGIINSENYKLIIGPTRQTPYSNQELMELAFRADVPEINIDEFISAIRNINRLPIDALLQALCAVNYSFSGEKLNLEDIVIYKEEQNIIHKNLETQFVEEFFKSDLESPFVFSIAQSAYDIEQTLGNFVRNGDTKALKKWLSSAAFVKGGILATNQLRQVKNTFIVTTTIITRAAIHGGMVEKDAYFISDSYIQECELLNSEVKIMNLSYHMILDFTERVKKLHVVKNSSKLVTDVVNYIQHHLSEPITVECIAKELFLSRPYLSSKFKKETGESLTNFILKEKVMQAKKLLEYSDKSIASIASYLGFSSQSHFSRVFKKYINKSPLEYKTSFVR